MSEITDEIKTVRRYSKDGGSWCIRCVHCREVIYVEDGDDDGTPRGEQYRCRCGGWNEVGVNAAFVRELPKAAEKGGERG